MPAARRLTGAKPEALFHPPPEQQPLAARMRPRDLEEFVGQAHLVGERGPLRRSVARGHLSSTLLWGPPGTGKTSLARLLADAIGAHFISLSAVMSGVVEVRATIAAAQDRLALNGTRTVLFLDEIHRFNKAQQDALLPHVEDGTITLVGATTENPYFEVNAALLSRMRVWRLEALTDDEVATVVRRALADAERGLAGSLGPDGGVALGDDAFEHLVSLAGGDARAALNVLEGAAALAADEGIRDADGHVDPASRGHRDGRSATRPRLRPRRRRPLRHGLGVHQEPARQRPRRGALLACGDGRRRRGPAVHRPAADHQRLGGRRERRPARPAGRGRRGRRRSTGSGCRRRSTHSPRPPCSSPSSPKSDSVGRAYSAALADVMGRGSLPVPNHLKTAGDRRMKAHGIGVGYVFPHDFEGDDVEQQYLPDELVEPPLLRARRPGPRGPDRGQDGRARGRPAGEAAAQERGRRRRWRR